MTNEIFAWVSDAEGDGILAITIGNEVSPAVCTTRRLADMLGRIVRAGLVGTGKRAVLRRFVAAEDIAIIEDKES